MGTSPCTVTVFESDFEPPPQAASERTPTATRALALPRRARGGHGSGSFMVGALLCVLFSVSAQQAGGVVQCALRIHDHRVDARMGLHEAQAVRHAQDEDRL